MKSRIKIVIPILITLTVIACQPFGFGSEERLYPSTIGTFQKTGDYTINAETIMEALDHGDANVFTPILTTPSPDKPLLPPGSVPWTQLDYLKVANALSQLVWNETLEDWNVYDIFFRRECQDNPGGFDSADIIYYKEIEMNQQKVYSARYIQIYPLASNVSWGGETYFPIFDEWNGINLTALKISADDALRIAEDSGGEEARSKVQNDCLISIRAPSHDEDNWDVYYYPDVYFEVIINPYSGSYEFPTPSP